MAAFALDDARRSVYTSSGEISYLDTRPDAGSGPATLFVHGVGTNADLWSGVIERLSGERRCVALDLPLHGRSPVRPDQDFSLPGLAAVLADFCDALGLAGIDLVANDTGGAVAQIFATSHPERLSTLTLTNCDTHDNIPPPAFQPLVDQAAAGLLAPGALQMLAQPDLTGASLFGTAYQDPTFLDDAGIRAFLAPVAGTLERGRQFERLLCSLNARDLTAIEPKLKTLTVPTLVVWGTDDVFFPLTWAYWLRDTIPGVKEVVEVPGGRLFFPHERPDDLVKPLRRFWGSVGAGHRAA
jgi:pimeloyl-ACP methyl ester carboxylesterase